MGTLIEKNQDLTDVQILAVGDNQAPINLDSTVGLSAIYYEIYFEVSTHLNALFQFIANMKSPNNVIIENIAVVFPPTGRGDEFRYVGFAMGRHSPPVTGDYKLDVGTLVKSPLGAGVTIKHRYLIGVST